MLVDGWVVQLGGYLGVGVCGGVYVVVSVWVVWEGVAVEVWGNMCMSMWKR